MAPDDGKDGIPRRDFFGVPLGILALSPTSKVVSSSLNTQTSSATLPLQTSAPTIQTSFEEENVGAEAPADPFYLFKDNGLHEVVNSESSDGDQAFQTGEASLGSPSAFAIDLDLSNYDSITLDVFTVNNNPNNGNIKISLDGAGYGNSKTVIWDLPTSELSDRGYSNYRNVDEWYYDCEVDLSDYDDQHTVAFWVDGDNNAIWDNIQITPSDDVAAGIIVNASENGGTVEVTQGTWKGTPENMIDGDPSTQWQVDGNPDEIIAIFKCREQARVTGDYLRIGTGGDRDVTEYELYARDSESDSWSLANTFTGSVTDDGTPDVSRSFDTPVEGKQFKLVITEHQAPELCFDECDVPIREYQLTGEFTGSGGGSETPTATITIADDARVVQTITNTRNSDVNDSRVEDPPIVSDVPASVAFGVTTDGLSELPDSAEVDIVVSKAGNSDSINEFTLTKEQVIAIENETKNGGYPVTKLAGAFGSDNSPPVFTPTNGTETVTIEIKNKETDSYTVEGNEDDPVTLNTGSDFPVKDRSLTIGVTTVKAPLIEADSGEMVPAYGDGDNGTIQYDTNEYNSVNGVLEAFSDSLVAYLTDEYPVSDVNVKIASKPIQGKTKGECDTRVNDHVAAYNAIQDEFQDVDASLLVVPKGDISPEAGNEDDPMTIGYYSYHGDDSGDRGIHYSNESVQPQAAASALWVAFEPASDSPNETAIRSAHELGHHFLPYEPYSGDYTFDGAHVVPDNGEDGGVVSTNLTIAENNYTAEDGPENHSFMSYADFGSDTIITDSETHRLLIESNFEPQPDEAAVDENRNVLSGLVCLAEEIVVSSITSSIGKPVPTNSAGDVIIRTLDGVGDIVEEQSTSRMTSIFQGSNREVLDIAQFVIPFGDTVAQIEVETGNLNTTINPISGTLSEIISALLADSFERNPEQRRSTLQSKLDEVKNMMEQRNYRSAANKLENDILDKLEKWLVDTDPDAANIPSKQDAIEQTQEMIDRVNTLEEEFGPGNGGNRGNGN